jgi:hypothetical protein
MRKLLICVVVAALAGLAGFWSTVTPGDATHYSVSISLYHPTGDATYKAVLTCGWHDVCDGVYPDASSKGLDWIWQSNVSYEVRARFFVVASLSTQTRVGAVTTQNATSGCYRIWAEVWRTDGSHVGTVTYQHSLVSTNKNYSLYGREQGIYSETSIGSMVWPDNCKSSGRHVMPWFTPGVNTRSFSKNTSIPTEQGCFGCNAQYSPWNTREYLFQYWHP